MTSWPDPPVLAERAALCDVLARQYNAVETASLVRASGSVVKVTGPLVQATLPQVRVGELCRIGPLPGSGALLAAEVIGFSEHQAMLSPFGSTEGVGPGMPVWPQGRPQAMCVGQHLLGHLLDGFGQPLSAVGPVDREAVEVPVRATAPAVFDRLPVTEALSTGVRVIDGLLTLGRGQRMGVFAGPGCGKTTLMKAIGAAVDCDVVVYALIGERGRELAEMAAMLEQPGLRERVVIVGATSDRSAGERMRAAYTATAIAEGFRAQGRDVLLLVDSLTRYVRAVREISIAAGEPTGRTGLPASVYAELPRLVERAGNTRQGSISALYMVLAEGAVRDDPIADEVRSLVDGHIVLSAALGEKGIYPAVNVLESLSRLMHDIVEDGHREASVRARQLMSRYEDMELLIRLGEVKPGADAETDLAIAAHEDLLAFRCQAMGQSSAFDDTVDQLARVARRYAAGRGGR
ncbi:ATP synthase in type III secretion protein N [Roseateles sp. YR242]|uniref:FliI/YscN family ATPase n=1 Tax=Roseateles sp. YR242 TaxID=1855305 RepID=UPI0008D7DDD3|nr:FliI/YscN family ATPase [Roseateles sp. YR242]SEK64010.1 ATP synthase in type III secretion protein N [Roseateles sp. YR242]